jgi:hypothetical protein
MRLWTRPDFKPIERKRHTYAAVAATFAGGALLGGGIGAYASGAFNGSNEEQPATPAWKPDPYVQKVQDFSFPYYTDMLQGKIDPYYAAIGQTGSAEFEKMLGLTTRDITNSANENLVRRGMSRSGVAGDVISRAVGDASTKLRYEDFNRALTGKLNLLQIGSSGLSGVRSAALTNQEQMNDFNMGAAGFDLKKYDLTQQQDAADAAMWGQILGSGVSAATGIYGTNMLSDALKAGTAQNSLTSGLGTIDLQDIYNQYK